MSSPLQQQDNAAAAAAGLAQLAASAPTPANQVPQQIWAARPPMPFQAGQSSLFLPGFASCLGASSTQQPAAVATAQAPQGGVGRVFQRALPNGGADSGVAMAPNAFGDVATTFVVCKFKKTPSHDSEIRQGLQMCSNPKCDKAAHYECYKKEVLAKHNVRPVIFPHTQIEGSPSGEAVVCSKTCHKKVAKLLQDVLQGKQPVSEGERLMWEKDGKNGEDDPNNSMSILLSYLTEGDNYAIYRGNKKGIKKITIANMLARKINDAGVRVKRDAHNIMGKITHLEQSYRAANDWANNTGVGVREQDEGTFRDAVIKRCKYFFELEPIMKDRASAKALLSSDDIENDVDTLSASSDEENEFDSSTENVGTDTSQSFQKKKNKTTKKKEARRSDKKGSKFDLGIDSSVKQLKVMKLKEIEAKKIHDSKELEEKKRHNERMESIEAKRQKTEEGAVEWKRKQDELAYMSALVDQFESLKYKGWNKAKIVKIFPSMVPLAEADDETEE